MSRAAPSVVPRAAGPAGCWHRTAARCAPAASSARGAPGRWCAVRRTGTRPAVRGCCSSRQAREGGRAGVAGRVVELLLDAQQLVVLRDALAAGRGAGLDLPAVGGDGEVGDRGVLGLTRAVAHHAAVAAA